MIGFIFRSLLWFSASFLILSIPVNEQPLFGHLSAVFGSSAQVIIDDFSERAEETVKVGKDAINKLFKAAPANSDRLELKQSGMVKDEEPGEDYTVEEREMLKNILKQKE